MAHLLQVEVVARPVDELHILQQRLVQVVANGEMCIRDRGNTNITLGVFDGEELLFVSRMATDASRMEDQYAIELRDILHLYGVRRAHISGACLLYTSSCKRAP